MFSFPLSDVTDEMLSLDVTFNIACELCQPMGKTEVSSTAKNRILSHRYEKDFLYR